MLDYLLVFVLVSISLALILELVSMLTLLLTGEGAQSARGTDYLGQCGQIERYRAETW